MFRPTLSIKTTLATPSTFFKPVSKKKILIVDDQITIRKQIARMLEGFDCEHAINGQEAVELVKKTSASGAPFSLIFMDLQMPIMNGQTATLAIRNSGDITTPIICVSTLVNNETELNQLTVGMTDFLYKQRIRQEDVGKILLKYCSSVESKKCISPKLTTFLDGLNHSVDNDNFDTSSSPPSASPSSSP